MFAGNCNGPGGNGLVNEPRTVGFCARQRKKQIARLDVAAVHGEAGDTELAGPRVHHGVIAEQVAKSHGFPNLLTSPRRGEVEAEAQRRLRVRGVSTDLDSRKGPPPAATLT